MQRYELEAWLGDNQGDLTDDQVTDLLAIADDIEARWPDEDDTDDREAALTVAYRLMVEDPEEVLIELDHERTTAQAALSRAMTSIKQAARILVPDEISENAFALHAGVDRMSVRKWLGKR